MTDSAVELIPSARRMVTSLRDMGYDISQALADIVDNSIAAEATTVAIDVEFEGDDSWVRISDNGRGMSSAQLREAMRYGADRNYGGQDLGKFGLGLKTASLSQCKRLSVASRKRPEPHEISALVWDLKHIETTNRWEVLPLNALLDQRIRAPLESSKGTVVLWEKLDRVLGYKLPYGEAQRKCLARICREIEAHTAMVFHRFLAREHGRSRLSLWLNSNQIQPWDPFCLSEAGTKQLPATIIPLEFEGHRGNVTVAPFVLPPKDSFSSQEAFLRAGGPAKWNQQQGFYIYRASRMIQSGGWSNFRAPDEHVKLARIAVSFSPDLDDAFKVNVAKMRVQLPTAIHDEIKKAIAPAIKLAQEVYGAKPPRSLSTEPPRPISETHSRRQARDATLPATTPTPVATAASDAGQLSFHQWSALTLQAAQPAERPIVETVLRRISPRE